jgi:hypothetical protein
MLRSILKNARATERNFIIGMLLTTVACGGKVMDDAPGTSPGDPGAPAPSATPSATPSAIPSAPVPPAPATAPSAGSDHSFGGSIVEACSLTCTDRGACGAGGMLSDCIDRCIEETTVSACASTAEAFWRCDAHGRKERQPEDPLKCGGLAPTCEPLYCALIRCQGGSVPRSCL